MTRSTARPPRAALVSRSLAEERRHLAAVALVLLLLYALSSPRTVALEDDGMFVMASYFGGVAHPPGYPLHSLLGRAFTLIPLGSVAYRVHLLSAVCGALSCAVIYWIAVRLQPLRAAGYCAALAYGVSDVFWSQAIIAEVYTLNALLLFGAFALALEFGEHGRRPYLFAVFALVGLGLANHWPVTVLSLPLLAAPLWARRQSVLRAIPVASAFLLPGLGLYGWMMVRSQMDPQGSFYGPLTSLAELWHVISRAGYATVDTSASATLADKLRFAGYVASQASLQLTPIGALVAALGVHALWSRARDISLALGAVFLLNTLGLALILGFDFDFFRRALFRVYPLVAYGIMSLWLAAGLAELHRRLGARPWLVETTGAALVIGLILLNAPVNWRAGYDWAERYGRAVLEPLEPNAILFVAGDMNVGPVGYVHHVLGVRPDVSVYHLQGRVFQNRLFADQRGLSPRARATKIQTLITRTTRPVYQVAELGAPLPVPQGLSHEGLVKKLDRTRATSSARVVPGLAAAFRWALDEAPSDAWTALHRGVLIKNFVEVLVPWTYFGQRSSAEERALLARGVATFHGGMVAAYMLLQSGRADQLADLQGWARDAEVDPSATAEHRALFHHLRGLVLLLQGDRKAAFAQWRLGDALDPKIVAHSHRILAARTGWQREAARQLQSAAPFDRAQAIAVGTGEWLQQATIPGREGPVRVWLAFGEDGARLLAAVAEP